MRWMLIVIILSLMKPISGQETIFETSDKLISIDFGYTTTSDLIKALGSEMKKQEKQFIYPEFSSNTNTIRTYDAVYVDSLPILLICQENTELIQDVLILKPIDIILFQPISRELNIDTLFNLLNETNLSNMKISTSETSDYWSFEDSAFIFYYKKILNENSISNNSNKNAFLSFENSISLLQKTTPDLLLIKHRIVQNYDMKFDSNGNRTGRPLYAPLTETHENKLVNLKPKPLMFLGSNWVKDGLWLEYYPNHLIRSKGTYSDGKKTGWFYYYDQSGKLLESKQYNTSKHQFVLLLLFGLSVIVISIISVFRLKLLKNSSIFN